MCVGVVVARVVGSVVGAVAAVGFSGVRQLAAGVVRGQRRVTGDRKGVGCLSSLYALEVGSYNFIFHVMMDMAVITL